MREMAILAKKLLLEGSKGSKEVEALFDTGASYSCIRRELATELGRVEPLPRPLLLGTAQEGAVIEVKEAVRLDFYLNGYRFSDEFMVVPGLSEECIIGAATMQKWRFKLDMENEEVIIDPRVTKFRLL